MSEKRIKLANEKHRRHNSGSYVKQLKLFSLTAAKSK